MEQHGVEEVTVREVRLRREMTAANFRSQGHDEDWITTKLDQLFPPEESGQAAAPEVEAAVVPSTPLPVATGDVGRQAQRKADRAAKRADNHTEHPVWYRRGLTVEDIDFLTFLTAFRYGKARHLALIHGTTEKNAYRRLKGLAEYGFVVERPLHDTASIWFPTPQGLKRTVHRDLLRAKPSGRASWAGMPHSFVVAYLAGAAQGGGLNVFNLGGFTAVEPTLSPKTVIAAHEAKSGELDVAEHAEMWRQVQQHNQQVTQRNVALRQQNSWTVVSEHLISEGFKKHGPDRLRAFGWLKIQTPATAVKVTGAAPSKVPDLVLLRDRPKGPFGDVFKVAVEVELNFKGNKKTKPLLLAYGHSDYDQVLYVVPDQQDRDNLSRLLADPDLRKAKEKITVLPLLVRDASGVLVAYGDDTSFLYRL